MPAVDVPGAPTVDDARAALLRLRTRFRTFAFADSERIAVPGIPVTVVDLDRPPGADESAFLVMLLTAVCRPSLWLAPGMLVHGPAMSGGGTGKGLLIRAMSVIAFGIQPRAMTVGENRDELDKRITAALIGAAPMVFLDNVNGIALKSDILASAITERPAEVRPLGSSTRMLLNSSSMVAVTGNGLGLAEDLTRRFVTVGLDARMENPETREFAGDFLANVQSAREELLRDLLTIWRWGRQRGDALPRGQALGSFEDWGRWCRDSSVALGCADPVARMAKSKAADPQRALLAELFNAWWEHHGDKLVTVTKLHDAVQRIADPVGKGRQFLATQIRHLDGTRVAGYLLTHVPAIGRWTPDSYQLTTTGDTNRQTGIGGIGDADTQAAAKRSGTADDPATRTYSSMEDLEEDEKKL